MQIIDMLKYQPLFSHQWLKFLSLPLQLTWEEPNPEIFIFFIKKLKITTWSQFSYEFNYLNPIMCQFCITKSTNIWNLEPNS